MQSFDERNRDLIVNVGGVLSHRGQAAVSPFDAAVQAGDAVWEGFRLCKGRIFKFHEHLARLRASAQALGFAQIPTDDEMLDQICRTLEANQMSDGVHIRLTLTRGVKIASGLDPRLNQSGPTLIVLAEYQPAAPAKAGLRLITSAFRRPPADSLIPAIQHVNLASSILAKIQANAAGVDEALMLDTRGFVAETTANQIFAVKNGAVKTPRTVACPEGVTRAVVLELCKKNSIPATACDLSLTELYRADELFCTSPVDELTAVIEVDGRTIGKGRAGATTTRLSTLFRETANNEGERVVLAIASALPKYRKKKP